MGGFQACDVIDLAGVKANGLSFTDHQLVVTEHGKKVADLRFAGPFTTGEFSLSPDGGDGTDIALSKPTAAEWWTLQG